MMLWACSGPGARAFIDANIHTAFIHAGVVAGLLAASALLVIPFRRTWFFLLICAGFLALHPAWTISARRGDCGILKAGAATLLTMLAGGIVLVQLPVGAHMRAAARRSRPDAPTGFDDDEPDR
jgi:hypothetical protein